MIANLLKLLGIGQRRSGLSVTCSDGYNRESRVVREPPFPYMHYYRTEVRNTLNAPLRIIWFDAFHREGWLWIQGNILGYPLNAAVFSEWYSDGEVIVDGVIPPGGVAVCDTNWHGSTTPTLGPVKWAYIAVDSAGKEHYAEVILEQRIVLEVRK